MFERGFLSFFRNARTIRSVVPREWLNNRLKESGLSAAFPPETRHTTQSTVKVFFNRHYFPSSAEGPFSLSRILTKIPAISVDGDRSGVFQNGMPFPNDHNFFSRIPATHPELLSSLERLSGAKKLVFSRSSVFASGGYPDANLRKFYKDPLSIGIFSLAAASFENSYLHYSLFMMDPAQNKISNAQFDHLYTGLPTDFREAQTVLGPYDVSPSLMRIRTGLPLLARSSSGNFYESFAKKNAIIFLSEAYFRHQLEDISLLLTAVNEIGKESGKPVLLKATAAGMGFFAKINGMYDVQHLFYPYYLRAYKKLLSENTYPWIKKIEFPTFTESQQEQFNNIMNKLPGTVEVYQSSRDVLAFTPDEEAMYFICVINPSDSFAYTGNEWAFSSVEAMIGLNSSLRIDQIPLENPRLLDPAQHVAVSIDRENFSAEVVDAAAPSINPMQP